MARRRTIEVVGSTALYVLSMLLYVVPTPEAAAHPCAQLTNNGTSLGTCPVHGKATHVCTTFGNGTSGTVCVGP